MSKLRKVKDSTIVIFFCPGCDEYHQIDTAQWEFNGDYDKPTFSPSYLCWNEPNPKALPEYDPKGRYRNGFRCHSFIKDGNIEYLSDCSHKLAGKTVSLPSQEDVTGLATTNFKPAQTHTKSAPKSTNDKEEKK